MLGWRLAISAVLIPLLIAIFVLDHRAGESAVWLLGLCIALVWRAGYEFTSLLRTRSFNPSFPLISGCSTAVVLAAWYGQLYDAELGSLGAAMTAISLSLLLIFLRGAIRYSTPGRTMETIGADLLGVTYLGGLFAMTVQLRWVAGAQAGYLVLASLVIGAKCGDIGGYTLGRMFGKKKLVPRLSPGKTWMGAFGALLGSSLACQAWLYWAPGYFFDKATPCPAGWSLLYGAVIGVVGLIGDLAESLIKRDVEKKDAANLMPGFGGLLDLLDSILYAGPVAFVLWKALPLVTW
ncbi:phosphatidate cytidylyltransferase [bacterium]|nr:phosphatidate cytidylyltransferase [bacterium]